MRGVEIRVGDRFRLPSGSVVQVISAERPNHIVCAYLINCPAVDDEGRKAGVAFVPEFLLSKHVGRVGR